MTYSFQARILSDEDIVALTRKQRPSAQAKALNHLGIDYKIRPDGTLLVLDDSVLISSGLRDVSGNTAKRKKPEVKTSNLSSLRNNRREPRKKDEEELEHA